MTERRNAEVINNAGSVAWDEWTRPPGSVGSHVPGTIQLDLPDYRLGAVSRQAVVMLLAASGGAALVRRWPILKRIVRGSEDPLPDELTLGLSLVFGPRARLVPPSGVIGPGEAMSVLVEAAFMPFAWTLTIGEGRPEPVGHDVRDWLQHPIDAAVGAKVELPTGTVQTAGPGDYRDERSISRTIEARRQAPDPTSRSPAADPIGTWWATALRAAHLADAAPHDEHEMSVA